MKSVLALRGLIFFNPDMQFTRLEPPKELNTVVECYWIAIDENPTPIEQKIIPDGFPEIIFHFGEPYRIKLDQRWKIQAKSLIAGQITKYFFLENTGASDMMGIKLKPSAVTHLFNVSMDSLNDRVVELKKGLDRKLFIIWLVIISTGCSQNTQPSTTDLKKLKWLTGIWNQTNIIKPGRTPHERWGEITQSELKGLLLHSNGTDTVFVEKTTILIKDNAIYYVADVPGNKAPVYFKFIELTETGFVCKNPEHDFPQKITYQLDGTKLKAQISGNGKAIDYYFEKK